MGQYVYWHAALWEVLLVAVAGLACLAWLAWRALGRPDLREALAAIDPALNEQALFLFDRVRGITCLNDGAERVWSCTTTTASQPAATRAEGVTPSGGSTFPAASCRRMLRRSGWLRHTRRSSTGSRKQAAACASKAIPAQARPRPGRISLSGIPHIGIE